MQTSSPSSIDALPFGQWLAAYRIQLDLTQDDLATRINAAGGKVTNGSVICHWEAGSRRPNGMNLLAMCEALGADSATVRRVMSNPNPTPLRDDSETELEKDEDQDLTGDN